MLSRQFQRRSQRVNHLPKLSVPVTVPEKVASVLMGGSETTFYTVAVYYGAIGIKNGRNTVPAALSADFAAAVLSVFAVNLFLR